MLLQIIAWLIALGWFARTLSAARGLPAIPNLLLPQYDVAFPSNAPRITIIVPALNEEHNIAATLESLIAQDYANLTVLAVDDRSTDATGAIMRRLAETNPSRLRVLTIAELPAGWLGKPHAMATAADLAIAESAPDYLLFTDADVLFRPDAIRRALVNAETTGAGHLVVFPTLIIHRWDEAALLSLFQIMGLWSTRPWRKSYPRSRQDAVGIGAFNMLRTTEYQRLGGFAALRMEIVEDLALARRAKDFGLLQRVAFGRDLVNVHWASGVPGIINVMTKNFFSVFRYNIALLILGCVAFTMMIVAPFLAIFVHGLSLPSAIAIVSILGAYVLLSPRTGIPAWNGLLAPFAGATIVFAILRSGFITLRQGGVVWRGTFYSLKELRRGLAPVFPRKR